MASAIRIGLLGGLTIEGEDGTPRRAVLAGRRSELVFAHLVAEHRRAVSRDELADALWPHSLPDSWSAAVRGAVSDVRRSLEVAGLDPGEILVTERSGYRLRLPPDAVVDIDEARAVLARARDELDDDDDGAAAVSAGRAEELASKPFLPRHDGDWVDGIRRELTAIRTAALELQVQALALGHDARGAAEVAERLVRADPFSEPAHRLRIAALAESGDRAGAVKAYEHCKSVLDVELGIEPSAETEALLRRAVGGSQHGRPAAPDAGDVPNGGDSAFAGLSVLVVEDHDFQRRTALTLLRGLGVGAVSEAAGGQAALELLAETTAPDVIVCDIDMPGMDGVEFVHEVAELGMPSAIVIASALDARLVRAVSAVCEGYGVQLLGAVEKPLTARSLGQLLAAYRRPAAARADPSAAVSGQALAEALARGGIVADYEAIVDLSSGRVCAGQAVARRADRDADGWVALVGAVEQHGLTMRFVDRMLELACAQLAVLGRDGLALDVWVCLPPAALAQRSLADRATEVVSARGGDPRRIVCVLDGRALRGDAMAKLGVLTRLRVKGFGLCLDGFPPGGTANEQLQRFPITAVRLDARLVAGAAGDPARVAVLQDAVDAAAALDLDVVGGGCSSAADFELLLQIGCGYGQGPFISSALPAEQLAGHAARWGPPPLNAAGPG